MAPDQTYCVACGERSGDLPSRIAKLIGVWDTPTTPSLVGVPPMTGVVALGYPTAGLTVVLNDWIENATFPSPRVAAFAVMSLLAFGVLMGSVVGANSTSSPFYVLTPATPLAGAAKAPETTEVAGTSAEVPGEAPTEAAGAAEEAAVLPPSDSDTTKINHVWLIVLSGQGYDKTFGNQNAQSYLTDELVGKGQLIQNYYAVAQSQLANAVALVSGQGPTWQSLDNCPIYSDLLPGTLDPATGQTLGDGCVHPESVKTLPDVIAATGKSSYAYVEDIDNGLNGRTTACTVPAAGAADADHAAAGNPYASWSNPLAYFKSFTLSANCQFQLGGLKGLETDLTAGRSPAFSLVVPNRCRSGSDVPCAPGAPTGLTNSDDFLKDVIPKIMSSKDYLDGGLIAITFDNAPQGTADADVTGCCGQPEFVNLATPPPAVPGPAVPPPASPDPTGPTGQSDAVGASVVATSTLPRFVPKTQSGENAGGGKVGLLLLSPKIKEGTVNSSDEANHFSMLLSIENWFGTEKLGLTNSPSVVPLPDSIFNKASAGG